MTAADFSNNYPNVFRTRENLIDTYAELQKKLV
jgi:hypothetical protein